MTKKYPPLTILERVIRKGADKLEELKKELDVGTDKDLYCGTAFVCFNKQSHADKVTSYFEVHLLRRAFSFLVYEIFR